MELLRNIFAVSDWVQILSLVAGIVFMIMQVIQHKWMWYFGICTAGAACIVGLTNFSESGVWAPLWAQTALNAYFLVMDIVGIFRWKKIHSKSESDEVHLVKLRGKDIALLGSGLAVLVPLVIFLLSKTNDPAPFTDGLSFSLSIIAQIMLTRSYLEQWYVWIAADLVAITVYASQSAWWMVALYVCYTINAVVGVIYWRKHGKYV